MPRQNLNVLDGKLGGKKCKVRKRGCSSSSSSSLVQGNYRLKRAFLVGKRVGSSTPVPVWKMMSLKSPLLENDNALFKYMAGKGGEKAKELPVSARKLGATLWEIDGLPSSSVNRVEYYHLEDKSSEVGVFRKKRDLEGSKSGFMELRLSDWLFSRVSERMDPLKKGSHRRRASAGSQKLLQVDGNLGGPDSVQNCLVEVDQTLNPSRSPCRNITGTKNRLKDVYNGLTTSKELLKVMSRIWRVEQQNSTCLSLVSALKFELDRACIHVHKLIQEQKTSRSDISILLKQFEEQRVVWKIKEEDNIQSAIASVAGELEIEKKLRRQTERVNKKLGTELAETKKELQSEKRAREIIEQVCDELARGIGEDKAEVEELKRQNEKDREEVEKEREMLQLADVLREERVQMKLSEAKYHFEEKNALVDKLKNDLEDYLKSKRMEEQQQAEGSPRQKKIKELEKYLRETLPSSYGYEDKVIKGDNTETVYKEEEEGGEEDDEDDDSVDSEFHSIELNVNDTGKSFQWNGGTAKIELKRNSFDKSKGRKSISENTKKQTETNFPDGIEWEFKTNNKHEDSDDVINRRGVFEFSSPSWKKDVEDEMQRYNMIKNLRDHIVSGSRMGSSQNLAGQASS